MRNVLKNSMKLLLSIGILISIIIQCSAQKNNSFYKGKLKKETEVLFKYGVNGNVSIDTLHTIYDTNGMTMHPDGKDTYSEGVLVYLDSTIHIDSTKSRVHVRNLFSDGQVEDIYKTYFKDSIVSYYVQGDTTEEQIAVLKHKRIVRIITYTINNRVWYLESIEIPHKGIVFSSLIAYKKWKFRYNPILRKMRLYAFNDSTKKWYLSERDRYNRRMQFKKISKWYYHNYWKTYFGDNTKYYYNKRGYLRLLLIKDRHLRIITEKEVYTYEFY